MAILIKKPYSTQWIVIDARMQIERVFDTHKEALAFCDECNFRKIKELHRFKDPAEV